MFLISVITLIHLMLLFARMARAFPEVYNFVPKTWILPSEYAVFQSYVNDLKKKKKSKTFIIKPPNGAMGNGRVFNTVFL